MRRILITGGCGFVGTNLALHFSDLGTEVLCLDNLTRRGSEYNLNILTKKNNISFIHGDIRSEDDFLNFKVKTFSPDLVLECSAQPSAIDGYDNPKYDITNNLYGLINVLEYCRKNNSALIFWSSNKSYSGKLCNSVDFLEKETRLEFNSDQTNALKGLDPTYGYSELLDLNGNDHSVYGASKIAAEIICQEWAGAFEIPVIINRFSCLYGPQQFGKVSQGWIVWFMVAKQLGLPLYYYGFNGKQVRDCLYVGDMCNLIEKQSKDVKKHSGSYFNVGGGHMNTSSILELNNKLDEMLGQKSLTRKIKAADVRRADQKIYISDIRKVSQEFNWVPAVKLEDGLKETLEWTQQNLTKFKELLGGKLL